MITIQALMRRYRGARPKKMGTRTWFVGVLSQAEAAQKIGISLRNWQNWESGAKTPQGLAAEELRRRLSRGKP